MGEREGEGEEEKQSVVSAIWSKCKTKSERERGVIREREVGENKAGN